MDDDAPRHIHIHPVETNNSDGWTRARAEFCPSSLGEDFFRLQHNSFINIHDDRYYNNKRACGNDQCAKGHKVCKRTKASSSASSVAEEGKADRGGQEVLVLTQAELVDGERLEAFLQSVPEEWQTEEWRALRKSSQHEKAFVGEMMRRTKFPRRADTWARDLQNDPSSATELRAGRKPHSVSLVEFSVWGWVQDKIFKPMQELLEKVLANSQ